MPNFASFALRPTVVEIQGCPKSEMHRMTSEWPWTLNSQRYHLYSKYERLKPTFWSVSLYAHPFSRYKVDENRKYRKCTAWPQTDPEHLTVKSTTYTLSAYPRGPNFGPFRSMTSPFDIQGFLYWKSEKSKNVVNDFRMTLNNQQS